MLLFTPEITAYLEMFEMTHSLTGGATWVAWQRTSLPAVGGVEDQPAKMMQAMTFLAGVHYTLTGEQQPKRRKRATKQKNV